MTAVAEALVKILDGLSEDKLREVVHLWRFPQQPAGDGEWERIIADNLMFGGKQPDVR